jgi:hypothetical protein
LRTLRSISVPVKRKFLGAFAALAAVGFAAPASATLVDVTAW